MERDNTALLHSAIVGLPPPAIGKVREVYDLGQEVLIVATDRISAFDVVMANGIPDKGAILTQMSAFWFEFFTDLGPHHLSTTDFEIIQQKLPEKHPELRGRTTLARKAEPLAIECVARGYLTGSLFKEYQVHGGHVLELHLPPGLRDGDRLPEPIFTPATKAKSGHDENLSFNQAADIVGYEVAEKIRHWTLSLYDQASAHALKAGIILADTKLEFGFCGDELLLIDEVLTPDSSRFWNAEGYKPGESLPSFDKQYVRDYLESIRWDKQPPGPTLPEDVIEGTRSRYLEAFRRLTGREFEL